MFDQKRYSIIVIIVSTLFITYLHYSTVQEIHSLHNIYAELYYIPVLLGALLFGLKGAILTYILVSSLYIPYIFKAGSETFLSIADKLLHTLFLGIFAFIAGFLVDRERRHRIQSEKARHLASLGQAASAIVHDLKNPLITITGFAKRIQEGKGNMDTALQTIMDSAQRMQRIVHDVLDFAKPLKLESKEEDIRNMINCACESCKRKADEKGVKLSVEMPSDSTTAIIDGFYIERAVINLINNAIDASANEQSVIISAEAEKDSIVIRIKDNGSGMDSETLEHVFIPFYSKKSSGTGLGMAIVKKIIDGHTGKIHIASQPNIGTEVMVEIPYKMTDKEVKRIN